MALPLPRLAHLLHREVSGGGVVLRDDVATPRELPAALAAALEPIEQRRSVPGAPAHMDGAEEWRSRLGIRAERIYRICIASIADEPIG